MCADSEGVLIVRPVLVQYVHRVLSCSTSHMSEDPMGSTMSKEDTDTEDAPPLAPAVKVY